MHFHQTIFCIEKDSDNRRLPVMLPLLIHHSNDALHVVES